MFNLFTSTLISSETSSASGSAISSSIAPRGSGNAWNDFWQAVIDFFLIKDNSGLNYLSRILISVAIIIISYFVIKFIIFLLKRAFKIKKKGPDIDLSAKLFIVHIVKILLWIVVAFLVTGMLKIDTSGLAGVTSAIAVALGLALQDLIGCFASGLLILNQKHIRTGDYVHVKSALGECEGTVTKIHLFMTYLNTPAGQEVTIPNNNMQKAIVTNYTKLGRRRLDYDVGVAYNTDIALAKEVLLNIVKDDPRVLTDADKVAYVAQLGDFAVIVRLRVWTKFEDYWSLYNELGEKILLACRDNKIYIPCSTDRDVRHVDSYI